MNSEQLYSSILAFLWGFGTVGVVLLVTFSLRLRLFAKGSVGDIGIILLDALVSKNVFLTFALGMVAYSRYTGYRFPIAIWTIVIALWLIAIWVSVIRIIMWFLTPGRVEEANKELVNDEEVSSRT
jgi:hypothetical protein